MEAMFVMDLDIAMDDGDPMSCYISYRRKLANEISHKSRHLNKNYAAVVENHLVAISAMFSGVVSWEQLNRFDLQVIWWH